MITEVLAGAWERLEQGRADIVIAPDMHFRSSSEINSRKLYTLMNVYVAAPDHPIHQEPEPLSEVTRVKYRGVAVADTARERPVLTVQLLDKQPRLTVSTIEDKRQALLAGLGVATMPYSMVEQDIAEGRLRVVSPESTSEIDIIMAWRRDSMGEAKALRPAGNTEAIRRKINSARRFKSGSRAAIRKNVSDRGRSGCRLAYHSGS